MAKLENVKVIDMVGGEVAKITYEGAEYTKIDGEVSVGDIAYLIAGGYHFIDNNAFYSVFEIASNCDPVVLYNDGDKYELDEQETFAIFRKVDRKSSAGELTITVNVNGVEDIEKLTREFEKLKALVGADKISVKEESKQLKVGDYVKVIEDNHEHVTGDILELMDYTGYIADCFDFRTKNTKTGNTGFISESKIVKLSEEEFAKMEETERWSAIGRKVNEYKVGDIVRVVKEGKPGHFTDHNEGDIGVVVEEDGDDRPRVDVNGMCQWSYVELISPVEARFDKVGSNRNASE